MRIPMLSATDSVFVFAGRCDHRPCALALCRGSSRPGQHDLFAAPVQP